MFASEHLNNWIPRGRPHLPAPDPAAVAYRPGQTLGHSALPLADRDIAQRELASLTLTGA